MTFDPSKISDFPERCNPVANSVAPRLADERRREADEVDTAKGCAESMGAKASKTKTPALGLRFAEDAKLSTPDGLQNATRTASPTSAGSSPTILGADSFITPSSSPLGTRPDHRASINRFSGTHDRFSRHESAVEGLLSKVNVSGVIE